MVQTILRQVGADAIYIVGGLTVCILKEAGKEHLAVCFDRPVLAVELNRAGALGFLAHHEVIERFINTVDVVVEHLAVVAEIVVALGQETVVVDAAEAFAVTGAIPVREVEVVILAVHQIHAVLRDAIPEVVQAAFTFRQTVAVVSALASAVLVEVVPGVDFLPVDVVDPVQTGQNKAGLGDAVGIPVDLIPGHHALAASEIRRAVVIHDTGSAVIPLAVRELAVFLEGISDKAVIVGRDIVIGGLIEVIPVVADGNPTVLQRAVDRIVVVIAKLDNTCLLRDLAAFGANNLVARGCVVVSGSGNGRAPLDNGVTNVAEGSAGVAVLDTGRRLVGDGFRGVNVGRAVLVVIELVDVGEAVVHLSIDMELLVREGIQNIALIAVNVGDLAHIDVHLHILCKVVVIRPIGCSSVAGNMDILVEGNNTDRDSCKGDLTGLIVLAGAGKGDGRGVGFLRNLILSGEALSKLHMVELPVVGRVEVDHGFNLLNGLNVGGVQIHPIDGTEGDAIQGCILGNQMQGGSIDAGVNLNQTDNNRFVACVVADLKLDTVIAVSDLNTGDRHRAAVEGRRNFNAVNKSLGGCSVQTGDIVQRLRDVVGIRERRGVGNIRSQIQGVIGCNNGRIAVHAELTNQRIAVEVDVVEQRLFSVVHSVGVVNGDVVDVIGILVVDGAIGTPCHVVLRLVQDDSQPEFALFAGHAVAGILIELVRILQRDPAVLADVH